MKKKTLFSFLFIVGGYAFGQEVVASQGGSFTNAQGSIDYTIGEPIIATVSSGSNDLTQGFHQTNWNFLGLDDFAPDFEIGVYPNPTQDELNIKSSSSEGLSFIMSDAQGKHVLNDQLNGELTTFKVGHLAPGTYNLTINQNGEMLKNFRLVKH